MQLPQLAVIRNDFLTWEPDWPEVGEYFVPLRVQKDWPRLMPQTGWKRWVWGSTRPRTKRELVTGVMEGFVETIHLFKTRPDIVVPMLQRYLKIEDRKAVEALHAFHVPLFQKVPRPSFPGMQKMRDFLVKKYPAAASLKEADIADSSFIYELERTGFIERLYAHDRG